MSEIAILKSTLDGHSDYVNSVAFHPTAPLLATGSYDETAKLWRFSPDGSAATCVATLAGHSDFVTSVAFHPTEPLLATGSRDSTAKLWRFSPDGSAANNMLANCVATLEGHSENVLSVAFDSTGTILATGSEDTFTKLWRFSPDGSAENNMQATCVATLGGPGGWVFSVAFHPTAPLLATGLADNNAKLWRFSPSGSAANNISAVCVATLEGHSDFVNSVAFHPTAPLLATGSGDNTAKLWRFSLDGSAANNMSAVCVATLEGHSGFVWSVAFYPTAPLLATGSWDKTVKLWRFSPNGSAANNMQATCVETLRGHRNKVCSVAFHSNAPLMATGSKDNTAKIWELNIERFSIVPSISSASAPVQNRPFVSASAPVQNRPFVSASAPVQNRPFVSASAPVQNRPSVSASASGQNRPSVLASANDPGLTIHINRDGKKIIEIKKKYLQPTGNSSNKSCPNFMNLYEKIMAIDLNGQFEFKFEGQSGQDVGGLTRSIFDKLLPVYTHKFFHSIETNNEFVILKDMDTTFVIHETKKLLLLANRAGAKIFLKIDPILLNLLLSPDLKKYFNNNKKINFTKFYEFINLVLNTENYDELSNNSSFLRINKNKNEKNRVIKRYKTTQEQEKEIRNNLLSEIRLRRLLAECGFSSWEQVQKMHLFIKIFWNPKNFSSELKFDIESFSKKLKILKENSYDNSKEIPLDKFVKLSKNNSMQFDFNNLNSNISKIYADYSFFRPFLNYILGPESTDEIRKLFVRYVSGTIYYPGELILVLSHQFAPYPFKSETCFQKLKFYKNNPRDPQFQINNATKFIKNQIKPNKNNVNFGLI
jgi:WD40 repeat protein